ncbi:MAG: tetratricopeptide repeat protein [Planctomycetia bacterium]
MLDLLIQAAVIVLAGLWIYSPAYHGDWLMDDDSLLTHNQDVLSGTLRGLLTIWINPSGFDYFPVSYSAMWLQAIFFGNEPTGYHITTILLHIASGLLLWNLLATMKIPAAWTTALIFTIHPVCVESVAWISEIKNTLSLALFLASCIFWVKQDDEAAGPIRERLYLLSLAFFLLAMLAKTSVVAMPVLTLLYAWWKRGRVTMQDAVRAAPLFLISFVLGIVTIQYQWDRGIGAETVPIGGLASRIALAGMVILFYLVTIVWPVHLLPIYPQWEITPPKAWQLVPWILIGGIAWWMWKNRETTWGRNVFFALGFFLLMIAPVLGFVDFSWMRLTWVADHFLYLPMIGPLALIVATAATWLEKRGERERTVFSAMAAGVMLFLAANSFFYAINWMDEQRLYEHTLAGNDTAWLAHNRLGFFRLQSGDIDAAYHHCQRATQLRPDLGETWYHLAMVLLQKGQTADALEIFRRAVDRSADPTIQLSLANLCLVQELYAEAREHYENALPKSPGNLTYRNQYALTLFKLGEREKAIEEFRRVLEIDPSYTEAAENLRLAIAGRETDTPEGKQEKIPEATE